MSNIQQVEQCNVCSGSRLSSVFAAPNLPLTGLYLDEPDLSGLRSDQEFLVCEDCGHGQLRFVLPASQLYDDTYAHRSSGSSIATAGNDFFMQYLRDIVGERQFESVLEVGCNDLYMLTQLRDIGKNLAGVDPIWIGNSHPIDGQVRVIGKFLNELDAHDDLTAPPDLIISAHTLEHIAGLYEHLAELMEIASDGCIFLIEMPCLDTMVEMRRFDQVFHQHIQHLSLESMRRLVSRLGGRYLGHRLNFQYWGGTLLFSFSKSSVESEFVSERPYDSKQIEAAYAGFRNSLRSLSGLIDGLSGPRVGFGAAQMLPVLAYHMESDLSSLSAILDDNPDRWGKFLPAIAPPIVAPGEFGELRDASAVITALDSARPILARLAELQPRRVLLPLPVI